MPQGKTAKTKRQIIRRVLVKRVGQDAQLPKTTKPGKPGKPTKATK